MSAVTSGADPAVPVRRYRAHPATGWRAEHAEGPMWDARTETLLFVDQFDGLVHQTRFDAQTRTLQPVQTFSAGSAVGAVVPVHGEDGWLLACAAGFAHLAADATVTLLGQPEADNPVPVRMNDGKCAPDGSFWAGSMAWDKRHGAGSLYRLATDLTVDTVLTDVTISNGLAWAGERTVFYIDTPTQRVDRLTLDESGRLTGRREAISIRVADGNPDGMCVDVDGCLWVALWNGHAVHRYSPDGALLAIVDVDAPQVSSCAFGGPAGRSLFITTSQEDMNAAARARHDHSGRVFVVDVDTRGEAALPFRPRERMTASR